MGYNNKKKIMKFFKILTLFIITSSSLFSQVELTNKIDSIMNISYANNKPGAAVIVVKDHKPIFAKGYGLANIESKTSITENTVFRIGSITKQFTSICILMMAEAKKLKLDDPVTKYFPELFQNHPTITLKQLLSHTSGVVDLSRIRAVRPLMNKDSKPLEIIDIISKEVLAFTPGSDYLYSNSGYVILGGILEKISGMSYKEILTENIFNPLKMTNTFYANVDEIEGQIAKGYFTRPDAFANAPNINSSLLFSAGGIWSTVGDMAKWNEGLYNETLIDKASLKLAFTPFELNDGKQTDYGFGFRMCQVNDKPTIEHGGGVFGYSSYGIRNEKNGVYVLLLTNFERENPYDEVAAKITALAINRPYSLKVQNLSDNLLKKHVGQYKSEDGDTLSILKKNNNLILKRTDGNDLILLPLSLKSFLIEESVDDRINFKKEQLIWKPRRAMARYASKIDYGLKER
jgi:CubicO group peptidase (beta-lactamase class C family)